MHIVHIKSGSCLGVWDNVCVQPIKTFTAGKTMIVMDIIVDAFLEQYLYKCIGFAASYTHISIHLFICPSCHWKHCDTGHCMIEIYVSHTSFILFWIIWSNRKAWQRPKHTVQLGKCGYLNKTGRTQAIITHAVKQSLHKNRKLGPEKHQTALIPFHSQESNQRETQSHVGNDMKGIWVT